MTTKAERDAIAQELADAAERGELTPIPGRELRGREAAEAARAILMSATGTTNAEDAARVALGRPRVGEVRPETRHWRLRVPAHLDDAARAVAEREGVTVSDVVRRAAAVGITAMNAGH